MWEPGWVVVAFYNPAVRSIDWRVMFFNLAAPGTDTPGMVDDAVVAPSHVSDDVRRVVYALSHDLRAPLRHIRGFLDELASELGDDLTEAASGNMDRVVRAVGVLEHSLDSLVGYARVTGPGPGPGMGWCDVGEVLALVEDGLRDELEVRHATIESGPLPRVFADRVQLEYVLGELVGNALKFGGDAVQVRVSANERDGHAVLVVEDNGLGVRTGAVDVFDLFRRCHDRSFVGTGVGLAAVRTIVAGHGGFVEFDSCPGAGSVVRFAMPLGARTPENSA